MPNQPCCQFPNKRCPPETAPDEYWTAIMHCYSRPTPVALAVTEDGTIAFVQCDAKKQLLIFGVGRDRLASLGTFTDEVTSIEVRGDRAFVHDPLRRTYEIANLAAVRDRKLGR
jgi:hypothetical protein